MRFFLGTPSSYDSSSSSPQEYGLAMLRGMGWKSGDGIGKTRKGVTAPVETAVRPKGLGLGADRSVKVKDEKKRPLKPGDKRPEEEEVLTLKTAAHVVVESGKHKDLYGIVEGMSLVLMEVEGWLGLLVLARECF